MKAVHARRLLHREGPREWRNVDADKAEGAGRDERTGECTSAQGDEPKRGRTRSAGDGITRDQLVSPLPQHSPTYESPMDSVAELSASAAEFQ